jgi:hypothetical protein
VRLLEREERVEVERGGGGHDQEIAPGRGVTLLLLLFTISLIGGPVASVCVRTRETLARGGAGADAGCAPAMSRA